MVINNSLLILLLCIWSLFCIIHSAKGKFYSIFSPKITWREIKQFVQLSEGEEINSVEINNLEKQYSKSEISDAIDINISGDDMNNQILQQMVLRVFSGSDSVIEKYRRLLMKDEHFIISLSSFPFGWRNFFFKVVLKKSKKPMDNFVYVGIQSLSESKILIRISIKKGKIVFEYFYKDGNISLRESQEIVPFLNHFLKARLQSEISVTQARQRQRFAHREMTSQILKSKQQVELDRIINPDKYRTKSATVRKPSTAGASSRYKPSSAAASRRVVKRK